MKLKQIIKSIDFKPAMKAVETFGKTHSSEILIGVAIVACISATVSAVKATPVAEQKIEETKEELGVEKLTVKQTVKVCWKYYIYPVLSTGASITAMILSHKMMNKRLNALTTAYALSETALREYRDKIVEMSPEMDKNAHAAVMQDKIDNLKPEDVVDTGWGETLCYDPWSGRFFKSSKEHIESSINRLAGLMYDEFAASLNDLYNELGLKTTKCGDLIGWDNDHSRAIPQISSGITANGIPYLELGFYSDPIIFD